VPEEGDYAAWAAEPFLFFVDAKGEPVAQRTAGDYADIGDFAYDYQPGAGEEVVPAAAARTAPPASIPSERYVGRVVEPFASAQAPARASVTLPGRALRAGTAADAPRLFALVTVALPPLAHGQEVSLYLGMSGMAARPDEALTLAVADHHAIEAPVTFTVPLPRALDAARAPARRSGDVILDLRIVPQAPAAAHGGHLPAPGGVARRLQLVSVVVEAH
jgi:tyrosinase